MKSSNIKNMTEGRPGRLILAFAVPLMAGNMFQQLYTVVDTMVVGKFLGVQALAALGAADWLNWMMLGIIQGLTQGFAIKMAQEFGAEKYRLLKKVIGNSGIMAAFFSLALTVGGQFLAKPVLLVLHTPKEILPDTLLYIRIMFMGIPVVMVYNLLACVLRSLGDSKTPLHAMVLASFTNIVLDVLFVYCFRRGIGGAAVATLIAQMISSVYCYYHIRRIDILSLNRGDFRMDR